MRRWYQVVGIKYQEDSLYKEAYLFVTIEP